MIDIGIIGLGLIGSSLGLAFKKYVKNVNIWGYDINEKHLQYAQEKNIIDNSLKEKNIRQLDILFLAVPVRAVIKILSDLYSQINSQNTIITDVGSTKYFLYQTILERFPELKYIGGHPMSGKEISGPGGADADLFTGNNYILLKPDSRDLYKEFVYLRDIISQFECNVISLRPDVHDGVVAFSSHLPQFLATCLMNEYVKLEKDTPYLFQLTGTGFKDMSRIAASDPAMWLDIFLTNKENILQNITDLEKQIDKFKQAIINEDEDTIKKLMNSGRKKRIQLEKEKGE